MSPNALNGGTMVSQQSNELLQQLLKSPIADKLKTEKREADLKERRRLVARLRDIPKEFAANRAQAEKRAGDAAAALVLAEAALTNAHHEHRASSQFATGVGLQEEQVTFAAQQALLMLANNRLAPYLSFLKELDRVACHPAKFNWWTKVQKRWLFPDEPVYSSNQSDIDAARRAIADGIEIVEGMKLEALSDREVTARLLAVNATLIAPLRQLSMVPPLVLEDEIKEPPMWNQRKDLSSLDLEKHNTTLLPTDAKFAA